MENLSHPTTEPSVAGLLRGIVTEAKELLEQEVAMLKLEARDELRKAKSAAFTVGIGIGIVAAGGNGRTAAVGFASVPRFSPPSSTPVVSSESFTSPKPQQGTESGNLGWFTDEIAALKSAAVGAVVSTLRGMFKQALPSPTLPLTSKRTKQDSQSSDPSALIPTTIAGTPINGTTIF